MDFYIGQKVKIAKNPSEPELHPRFTEDMNKWRGKTVTITGKVECTCGRCYSIKEDREMYVWNSRWFKPLQRSVLEIENNTVTLLQLKPAQEDGEETKRKIKKIVPLSRFINEIIKQQRPAISITPALPPGTKFYLRKEDTEIVVLEEPPCIRTIKIECPEVHQHKERYNLAFPYIVYIMHIKRGYLHQYGSRMFYRTMPINNLNEELMLPNISHTVFGKSHYPVGTICLQAPHEDYYPLSKKVQANIKHYWNTTFAFPEAGNNFFAGFKAASKLDPRIETLEAWEQASLENPLFVLDISWIEADLTINQVINEILGNVEEDSTKGKVECFDELVDLMYKIEELE